MPFADVLRGLKALFLEGPEAASRTALLAARAPGLSADERGVLVALEADRLGIYVGMLRENQAVMLEFVAPMTVELAGKFGRFYEAWLTFATIAGWALSTVFLLSFSRLGRANS